MKAIIGYAILAFAIMLIPYEITAIYKNVLFKKKAAEENMPKPIIIFLVTFAIEALYLIYLYFTKIA